MCIYIDILKYTKYTYEYRLLKRTVELTPRGENDNKILTLGNFKMFPMPLLVRRLVEVTPDFL